MHDNYQLHSIAAKYACEVKKIVKGPRDALSLVSYHVGL